MWTVKQYILLLTIFQYCVCPPVTKKSTETNQVDTNENEVDHLEAMGIEYNRYLKQVVEALESDADFRHKLENAQEADIRSGKIAEELDFVNHHVRTKLDELKRQELERLRSLAKMAIEKENNHDSPHLKEPEHLDHGNPNSFEIVDLHKLIKKVTEDLEEADKKRRADFKQYEMQKEFEQKEKMKDMDDEHKKEYEQELEELKEKHKKHDPLHHPGSKQQLEEVWEKQDHMEQQEFNPKTFFFLHDLDGNGFWDQEEVKALFLKELDKLYQAGVPEDDMRERAEEMERMREHVFKESDTNRDGLISFEEFLQQTKKPEFDKDQGWETLDQQQVYTPEEYAEFERRRQEEIQRLIREGKLPPHPPGWAPPPGAVPPQYQYQGQGQYGGQHPNSVYQQPQQQAYQQQPQQQAYQQQPQQQVYQQQQQQQAYQQQQQQLYQQQQQQQQAYHQQQYQYQQQPPQQGQPQGVPQKAPLQDLPVQPPQQASQQHPVGQVPQQQPVGQVPQQQQPVGQVPQQQQPAIQQVPQQQQPTVQQVPQQQPVGQLPPQKPALQQIPQQQVGQQPVEQAKQQTHDPNAIHIDPQQNEINAAPTVRLASGFAKQPLPK